MKIVATSDLHGTLPPVAGLPSCDVLVIAGDVCPVHDHSLVFQKSWLETNFTFWLDEVLATKATRVLGIGGNHDFALERWPELGHSLPWTYLLDTGWIEGGVHFHGSPWVPNLSRWAFHGLDHFIDEKMFLVECDVLISHGPPHSHCDLTVPRYGSCHAGFPDNTNVLDRCQLMICGHIHEGYGYSTDRHGGLKVANVAHMTEAYEALNPPVAIFFDKYTRRVTSFEGNPRFRDQREREATSHEEFMKIAY